MRKIKKLISLVIIIYLAFALISCRAVGNSIKNTLKICVFTLLPALFPFMILSNFISQTDLREDFTRTFGFISEKLFHCPRKYAHILFLSLIGGYPVGAIMINSALEKGDMSYLDGEKLLCFCVNCSPAFIINAVGVGILGSIKAGIIIWLSEILACIFIANFVKIKENLPTYKTLSYNLSYTNALVESVNNSVKAILSLFGFSLAFSAFSAILENNIVFMKMSDFIYNNFAKLIFPRAYYDAFVFGILEISGGIFRVDKGLLRYMSLFSFLTAFGGIGVIFQIRSIIKANINLKPFLLSRLAMGFYSVFLTEILRKYFLREALCTVAGAYAVPYVNSNSIIYTFCMLSMIITVLLKKEEIYSE